MNKNDIKSLFKTKGFYTVFFLVIIDIILFGLLLYGFFFTYQRFSSLIQERVALEENRQKAQLVRNNKQQLETDIADYNAVLDRLIPNQESYFQIINAFEKLSLATNLPIENYTINVEDTTSEKISFSLRLTGSSQEVNSFLKNFNYSSGRLIVSDSWSLLNDGTVSTLDFDISMFNAIYAQTGDIQDVPVISSETIEEIKKITELVD
jgi:hypothetical protein